MNYNKQLRLSNELGDTLDQVERSLTFMILKEQAVKKCGNITPCGSKKTLEDCLIRNYRGKLQLWYNDENNSTRIEEIR